MNIAGRAQLQDGADTAATHAGRLSDRDFSRICTFIHERTGIRLTHSKRLRIETGLRRRASVLRLSGAEEYCRMVFDEGGLAEEVAHLIHLATTNKTDFFRERAHFDFLETRILPEILATRPAGRIHRLKMWSAAASNGAEAYTAAMVLAAAAARGPRFDFAVLGTDISAEMVADATRAVYPASWIEPVPPALRERYFMRSQAGASEPLVRIVPELRRHVRFARMNLVGASYPVDRDVDVILVRNVLIYFDPPTQKAVVQRLAGHLRPGGHLILGHTEAAVGSALGLRQCATGIFRIG
ncbi:CheR family methyltransferase [Halovulum dunhuangense]|uniref:CheR family methyltransferase n=1 Tax=Halovulum dunhuangense TaxID=1505036 RepID=UPI0031B63356